MDEHEDLPAQRQRVAPWTLATARLGRNRWAAAACFGLTGFVFATWAARIPTRQADLELSDAQLALAFVGLNAGAILGLQLGGLVVPRVGSRTALAVGLPMFAGMLLPLALAPTLALLTVALAVSAVANSVVDVAINDQAVGLQHRYGRSLLSGLHALHSLGGVLGGALAALAAHAGLSMTAHFTIAAIAVAGIGMLAAGGLLSPRGTHVDHALASSKPSLRAGWTGRIMLLGVLAFVFTLAEGSSLDWSAVLLREGRHAGPATAAAALAVFQAAVTTGRLAGDRIIDRAGPVRVIRAGAPLAGAGFAAGLLTGTAPGALAGLALFGLGLATLLPIAISAAGADPDVPVPVAVARVSTFGYLGSFAGPLVIGALTHVVDLAIALLLPAVAVATTAFAADAIRTSKSRDGSP